MQSLSFVYKEFELEPYANEKRGDCGQGFVFMYR
mgnify:CR=1 FL=1